jgi:hypothetical protein
LWDEAILGSRYWWLHISGPKSQCVDSLGKGGLNDLKAIRCQASGCGPSTLLV